MATELAGYEAVLRLANAVVKAGGNARLLNEDNSAVEGWWPIDEAAQSGQSFFVDLKDTLSAFDLDDDELVARGEELETWARSEGLSVVLVSSGRPDHRHLYVYCEDRAQVEKRALEFGIPKSAHRRSIRPPLAPHRKGFATSLIRPQTLEEALEALGPMAAGEGDRKNLPEWLIHLIEAGDTSGRYISRSAMALAIASGLRRAGYDFHEYRNVMANRENLGGAKYHALSDGEGREEPDTFLVRTWEKAGNSLSPADIVARLSAAKSAVLTARWTGRTGNTDKAVMLALCELGTGSGTTQFAFGVRRIALVAQVEDKTVRKALGRLVDAGWLERFKSEQLGHADGYRLGQKVVSMTASIPSPHRDKCGSYDQVDPEQVLLHPLFRNKSGLGKGPGRTWLKLTGLDEPATAKEIAESIGSSRRTVDRHLETLNRHGLVMKDGKFWTAVGDVEQLDGLALELGAVDRLELQRERYERNRAGFRAARGLPPLSADGWDDSHGADTEDEFRRWYEEQLLLKENGLPHYPVV